MSKRIRYKPGDILIRDEGLTLYGHLNAEAFRQAMVDVGEWDDGSAAPGQVRQTWYRWTPAQPGDDYSFWAWPAEPHSRGAFPVTVWEEAI